jgi:hypothetical protein
MPLSWNDLTPEGQRDHLERIERALEGHEETKAALQQRQAYNATLRAMETRTAAAAPTVTKAAEIEHPVQRPASAPRDWVAERAWVEGIIEAKLAPLPDGIGRAIGEIRAELRKEFEAKLILARRDTVDEVRRDFTQQIADMRSQFRTALAGDEDQLLKRLQKIDAMLDRWQRIEFATRTPTTIDLTAH